MLVLSITICMFVKFVPIVRPLTKPVWSGLTTSLIHIWSLEARTLEKILKSVFNRVIGLQLLRKKPVLVFFWDKRNDPCALLL